jgi:hypothetical protein
MTVKNISAQELRLKYPRFIYEKFAWDYIGDNLSISFKFKTEPDLIFEPEITIEGIAQSFINSIPEWVIDNLCFHLGLVEMLSYWKATCSPEILIRAGYLNDDQLSWWNDLLLHGMGEYFFVNDIDFTQPNFLSITVDNTLGPRHEKYENIQASSSSLILTSGGKDTALTLSIFSSEGLEFNSLILNPVPAALDLAHAAGVNKPLVVRREISPELIRLNGEGYLNGHTPFSSYLAFLGTTCAVLFGYDKVIVSNERSSDEGNVQFLERDINHQYSKTLRFERKFQQYAARYLTARVQYFSFLRPLYDIQIMHMLASYPESLALFKSCNRNQKLDSWCGQCPKCLSVYTMLYPFVDRGTVISVFGRDPFEDANNIKIIQELAGVKGHKPFECVGTRRETIVGLHLGLKRAQEAHNGLPAVWSYVEREVLPHYNNFQELDKEILMSWGGAHCLPPDFEAILRAHFDRP